MSPKNMPHLIVPGEKYGKLTVLSYSHLDKRSRRFYNVICECGQMKTVQGTLLRTGNTKSCGCLAKEVKQSKRISKNHSEITAIILGYKRHAMNRNFKWLLERKFVEELIQQDCFYCGTKPSNIKITKNSINGGLLYSGIDRINSAKDYAPDNVVPCCKICNYAKSNMSIDEFKEWAIKIGKRAMAEQWTIYFKEKV